VVIGNSYELESEVKRRAIKLTIMIAIGVSAGAIIGYIGQCAGST